MDDICLAVFAASLDRHESQSSQRPLPDALRHITHKFGVSIMVSMKTAFQLRSGCIPTGRVDV